MDSMFGASSGNPTPWGFPPSEDRLAQPAILVVEDDRDIRDMLAMLLDMAGFKVQACESAECGLNALREAEFDLILTDYALPRQSGLWLLEHAEAEGLIEGTPVMIVTAHPHVAGAAGAYEIIHKPFDLDDLIERVRYRVEGEGPRRRRIPAIRGAGGLPGGGTGNGDEPGCPEPVELILYVSSQSARSFAAVRNIKKVLKRFKSSRVKLTVCDLALDPARGIEDSVAFTPTLVRKTPGPRTFILGHVTNPELVLELLADCESEES
jgi:DNA-binding response OmpR family regulator